MERHNTFTDNKIQQGKHVNSQTDLKLNPTQNLKEFLKNRTFQTDSKNWDDS